MKRIKVMIAEDFTLLREDLADTLARQPEIEVVGAAASGAEIEQLALARDFDILLMDVEMETANAGIKATERIMEHKPLSKILFLTAHETENIILTSMGAGAVDYIVKGCTDEELLRHIFAAYSGRPILDANIQNTVLKEYSRLRRSENSLLFFINNVSQLTTTERALVKLLLEGKKVKEIAEIRCVEMVTVKTQIKGLLRKFGCGRTKEIVQMIEDLNVAHLF